MHTRIGMMVSLWGALSALAGCTEAVFDTTSSADAPRSMGRLVTRYEVIDLTVEAVQSGEVPAQGVAHFSTQPVIADVEKSKPLGERDPHMPPAMLDQGPPDPSLLRP